MYHPGTTRGSQYDMYLKLSWTTMCVPGGKGGVLL